MTISADLDFNDPDDLEQLRRRVAALLPGAPALQREETLRLLTAVKRGGSGAGSG